MAFLKVIVLFSGFLFFLSWLLPNHYYPWTTFYNDFSAFLALFAAGIATLPFAFRVGRVELLLLVLTLVPAMQYFLGIIFFAGDALIVSFYLLALGYSIALGRSLRVNYGCQVFDGFAWVIVAGASVSALVAFFQLIGVGKSIWIVDLPPGGRPFANLAQPNNLATLISCGLASLLLLLENRRISRALAGVLSVGLVIGLVLTQSRTPWLGAIVLLVWWCLKKEDGGLKTKTITLLVWVFCYALAVLLFSDVAQLFGLEVVAIGERLESVQRLDIWRQMVGAVIEGPLWGYGWNQVGVAQLNLAIDVPVAIQIEHSHNLVLDLLVWNGPLLGTLILVLGVIWLARLAWRARGSAAVLAVLVVGLVLLHAMLEFPLEYAYFLLPVGLLLGMTEADLGEEGVLILPRWVSSGAVAVFFISIIWVWQEYQVVESDHRLMRFETARIGGVSAEQSAPNVLLLSQLREFLRFARTQAVPGMGGEQLEWMRKVAYRYPFPPCLFRYVLALALNGQVDQARIELMRLRSLHGEKAYKEARRSLSAMVSKYPQLAAIALDE